MEKYLIPSIGFLLVAGALFAFHLLPLYVARFSTAQPLATITRNILPEPLNAPLLIADTPSQLEEAIFDQNTLEMRILPAMDQRGKLRGTPLLSVNSGSDPGVARKHSPNEDNVLTTVTNIMFGTTPMLSGLFVVADGMGGHICGREASLIGIQTMNQAVCTRFHDLTDGEHILTQGVQRANAAIYKKNQSIQSANAEKKG